jgi:hypothetical protein
MCCYTHTTIVPGGKVTFRLAEEEFFRCRCQCVAQAGLQGSVGGGCPRRATEEDLRCDVCRNPDLWPADANADRYQGPGVSDIMTGQYEIIRNDGGVLEFKRAGPERYYIDRTNVSPEVTPQGQEDIARYFKEQYLKLTQLPDFSIDFKLDLPPE